MYRGLRLMRSMLGRAVVNDPVQPPNIPAHFNFNQPARIFSTQPGVGYFPHPISPIFNGQPVLVGRERGLHAGHSPVIGRRRHELEIVLEAYRATVELQVLERAISEPNWCRPHLPMVKNKDELGQRLLKDYVDPVYTPYGLAPHNIVEIEPAERGQYERRSCTPNGDYVKIKVRPNTFGNPAEILAYFEIRRAELMSRDMHVRLKEQDDKNVQMSMNLLLIMEELMVMSKVFEQNYRKPLQLAMQHTERPLMPISFSGRCHINPIDLINLCRALEATHGSLAGAIASAEFLAYIRKQGV